MYTIPYYIFLLYTILYYTILYYTILYYTILYYTILYYTILYYTILYNTILYYSSRKCRKESRRRAQVLKGRGSCNTAATGGLCQLFTVHSQGLEHPTQRSNSSTCTSTYTHKHGYVCSICKCLPRSLRNSSSRLCVFMGPPSLFERNLRSQSGAVLAPLYREPSGIQDGRQVSSTAGSLSKAAISTEQHGNFMGSSGPQFRPCRQLKASISPSF